MKRFSSSAQLNFADQLADEPFVPCDACAEERIEVFGRVVFEVRVASENYVVEP